MYKLNINGLVKRTNKILCSMLTKEVTKVDGNICNRDLTLHQHVS
jgi:hypothetical protein